MRGTMVTLIPQNVNFEDMGQRSDANFTGWGGACSSFGTKRCVLKMNGPELVTAKYIAH
jgi:hypothetical protein